MGIKKYIVASILLIIAIAGYVFSVESGDYRVVLLDKTLIFPIALAVHYVELFLWPRFGPLPALQGQV